MKKALSVILTSVLCACTFVPLSASAHNFGSRTTTNINEGKTDFSRSWHKTWTMDCTGVTSDLTYSGSVTIGFDTFWTDEDYVDGFGTLGNDSSHYKYARVTNSDGVSEDTPHNQGVSATGKGDVEHVSSPVTYFVCWGAVS